MRSMLARPPSFTHTPSAGVRIVPPRPTLWGAGVRTFGCPTLCALSRFRRRLARVSHGRYVALATVPYAMIDQRPDVQRTRL